jgi:hypothetical protein
MASLNEAFQLFRSEKQTEKQNHDARLNKKRTRSLRDAIRSDWKNLSEEECNDYIFRATKLRKEREEREEALVAAALKENRGRSILILIHEISFSFSPFPFHTHSYLT